MNTIQNVYNDNSITEDDLEALYGNVNDDVIIEVAKRKNFKLPEDMRDEYESETFDESDAEVQQAQTSLLRVNLMLIRIQR